MTITIRTAAGEVTAIGTPIELGEFVALLADKPAIPKTFPGTPFNQPTVRPYPYDTTPFDPPPYKVEDWVDNTGRRFPHQPMFYTDLCQR